MNTDSQTLRALRLIALSGALLLLLSAFLRMSFV